MTLLKTSFLAASILLGSVIPVWAETDAEASQAAYNNFQQALQKRIASFDAKGKSLKEVIDQFRKDANLNIVIDPKVYEKGGTDVVVNLSLTNVRVESVLKVLLRMFDLSADYQDEVLYITMAEDQFRGQEVVTQTYDVRNVITPRPEFLTPVIPFSLEEASLRRRRELSLFGEEQGEKTFLENRLRIFNKPEEIDTRGEALVEMIRKNVASRSWRTDERVSITYNKGGTLTVTHTLPVQLQILRLIQEMEK
jgi:hypothetical protein